MFVCLLCGEFMLWHDQEVCDEKMSQWRPRGILASIGDDVSPWGHEVETKADPIGDIVRAYHILPESYRDRGSAPTSIPDPADPGAS